MQTRIDRIIGLRRQRKEVFASGCADNVHPDIAPKSVLMKLV